MKDNFSTGSKEYAQFRPHYPEALFGFLLSKVKKKGTAWDCGTGNGQVAGRLAADFTTVFATDISRQQLDAAVQKKNIHYSVQPAEQTDFQDAQFDLVTVAQAIHWFRFDKFYAEVKRVLKPGGIFAVIGYGLFQTEPRLQQVLDHFYLDIVGPYWDAERRYLDEHYQTIPFPFSEIASPAFDISYEWTFDQLAGYLRTWSAVRHFINRNQSDPLEQVLPELHGLWNGRQTIAFRFPILFRVGV